MVLHRFRNIQKRTAQIDTLRNYCFCMLLSYSDPKEVETLNFDKQLIRCDVVRSFRWYDDLMCFIINTILTISAMWKLFMVHWISFSLDANWVAHSANDGGSWKLRKYFSKKSSSHGHPWNSRTTCLTNVENINWAWDGLKFRQKQKWMTQNCKSIVTTSTL